MDYNEIQLNQRVMAWRPGGDIWRYGQVLMKGFHRLYKCKVVVVKFDDDGEEYAFHFNMGKNECIEPITENL